MKKENQRELLSPGEASALLGVSPSTLNKWMARRMLPAFKTMGGHARYRVGDIKRLLEDQQITVKGREHNDK